MFLVFWILKFLPENNVSYFGLLLLLPTIIIIISDNNIGKTFSHWSQSVKQKGVSTQLDAGGLFFLRYPWPALSDCNHSYLMTHTFSFVIPQPLSNVQPSWIFNKLKVRGGLDNVAGKSGADELNWFHNY